MNFFDSLCKGCSMQLLGCLLPIAGFGMAFFALVIALIVTDYSVLGVVLGVVAYVAIFAVTIRLIKRLIKAMKEEKKNSKY